MSRNPLFYDILEVHLLISEKLSQIEAIRLYLSWQLREKIKNYPDKIKHSGIIITALHDVLAVVRKSSERNEHLYFKLPYILSTIFAAETAGGRPEAFNVFNVYCSKDCPGNPFFGRFSEAKWIDTSLWEFEKTPFITAVDINQLVLYADLVCEILEITQSKIGVLPHQEIDGFLRRKTYLRDAFIAFDVFVLNFDEWNHYPTPKALKKKLIS